MLLQSTSQYGVSLHLRATVRTLIALIYCCCTQYERLFLYHASKLFGINLMAVFKARTDLSMSDTLLAVSASSKRSKYSLMTVSLSSIEQRFIAKMSNSLQKFQLIAHHTNLLAIVEQNFVAQCMLVILILLILQLVNCQTPLSKNHIERFNVSANRQNLFRYTDNGESAIIHVDIKGCWFSQIKISNKDTALYTRVIPTQIDVQMKDTDSVDIEITGSFLYHFWPNTVYCSMNVSTINVRREYPDASLVQMVTVTSICFTLGLPLFLLALCLICCYHRKKTKEEMQALLSERNTDYGSAVGIPVESSASTKPRSCALCNGSRQILEQITCTRCGGTGTSNEINSICTNCAGVGFLQKKVTCYKCRYTVQ
jgi:hypothetical protein